MTDPDTSTWRRLVDDDPASGLPAPDVATLILAGRRERSRRRALAGAVAVAIAGLLVVPALAVSGGLGGDGDRARDTGMSLPPLADQPSAPPSAPAPPCGVFSCATTDAEPETDPVVAELPMGDLAGGAQEVLYLVRSTESGAPVDVLDAGYRSGGELRRTVWALQPATDAKDGVHFWSTGGAVGEQGPAKHLGVIGYVEGAPESITWSTPDGRSGPVDGTLALEGYTAFYLSRPLNADGGQPELTFHTSDGWSCALAKCGSVG